MRRRLALVAWLPLAAAAALPPARAGEPGLPSVEAREGAELPSVEARPPLHTDATPQGPSVDERLAEIARRVQRASRYPALARERGATGEALVAFEIGGNGVPRDVALLRTSGSGALDHAALRAVAEAAPLPFVYGRIQVPVRFSLDDPE